MEPLPFELLDAPFQQMTTRPLADYVFVHGFVQGRWGSDVGEDAWTNSVNDICWPLELFPLRMPQARVFFFGYDLMGVVESGAQVVSARLREGLKSYVATKRTATKTVPIVFVAHGIGGHIVQEALTVDCKEGKSQYLPHVSSVFLLDTPRFTEFLDWQKYFRQIGSDCQCRPSDVQKLVDINSQFEAVLKSHELEKALSNHRLHVSCYYTAEKPLVKSLTDSTYTMSVQNAHTIKGKKSFAIPLDYWEWAKFSRMDVSKFALLMNHLCDVRLPGFSESQGPIDERRIFGLDIVQADEKVSDRMKAEVAQACNWERMRMYAVAASNFHSIHATSPEPNKLTLLNLLCDVREASNLRKSGKHTEAVELCEKALQADTGGSEDLETLRLYALEDLALALLSQGQVKEAHQRVFGELKQPAPKCGVTLTNHWSFSVLAPLLSDSGCYRLAELITRDFLVNNARTFGLKHADTATLATELTLILLEQNRNSLAEGLAYWYHKRLMSIYREENPVEQSSEEFDPYWARQQAEQGDNDDEESEEDEWDIEEHDVRHQSALSRIATVKLFQGKTDEFEQLLERLNKGRVLPIHGRVYTTASVKFSIGVALVNSGDFPVPVSRLENAHALQSGLLGDHDPRTSCTREALQRVNEYYSNIRDYHPGLQAQHFEADVALKLLLKRSPSVKTFDNAAAEMETLPKPFHAAFFGSELRAAAFIGDLQQTKKAFSDFQLHNTDGADPKTRDIHGRALQAAVTAGRGSIVHHLLTAKDRDIVNYSNDEFFGTLLHEAAMRNSFDIVATLLCWGADVNVRSGHHGTALHAAAWNGAASIVEALLRNGADDTVVVNGRTALKVARSREMKLVERALQKHRNKREAKGGQMKNLTKLITRFMPPKKEPGH